MKRTLVIITNHFPFGLAEAFLEPEIEFHRQKFDKVLILARDVASIGERALHPDIVVTRMNPQSNAWEKFVAIGQLLRHFPMIFRLFVGEVRAVRQLSSRKLQVMIHDVIKAVITAAKVRALIDNQKVEGDVYLYSYWLNSSALATLFVKWPGKVTRFARAHGGDVYEFRVPENYLSFRSAFLRYLDRIFTISESARRHLLGISPDSSNVSVSRLGVKSARALLHSRSAGDFLIVSCAFMLPVKRIDLAIDALSRIDDVNIRWIHIGDGPLREQLTSMATTKLGGKGNISFSFAGAMDHSSLMRFYEENFVDLFLNTSSSEGIPVTMMEAQSFGIPIVAPDVGGISEIVNAENGFLYDGDSSAAALAAVVRDYLKLPPDTKQVIRANALRNWEMRYNAEKNFPTFVAEILNL